jgi:hypothetical protein
VDVRRDAEGRGDTSEVPYIRAALQRLDAEEQQLAAQADQDQGQAAVEASDAPVVRTIPAALPPAAHEVILPKAEAGEKERDSGLTVFFQAGDGQRIYLAPVNAQILKKEHGDIARAPPELAAAVLQIDRLTVTDETRRRYKFLAHLPVGSEAALAELDLAACVSQETLAAFADELAQRAAKRKAKAAKEKADARRAARQAQQQHDAPAIADMMQFPVYTPGEPPAVYVPDPALLLPRPHPQQQQSMAGPSFAQAAKAASASAAPPAQPHSAPASQRPTPAGASRMVPLGRGRALPAMDGAGAGVGGGGGSSDEELAAPAFSTSFSLALQEAWARYVVQKAPPRAVHMIPP